MDMHELSVLGERRSKLRDHKSTGQVTACWQITCAQALDKLVQRAGLPFASMD